MTIDPSKSSNVVNNASKAIDIAVVSKNKVDKTANKINYWALFGLIFLTLGIIATTIATCGINQIIFHATVATLDFILGIGAITFSIGAISITKALRDRSNIINNPKRYGVVGIENQDATSCWLNSLMQMLLNIPDLKMTLKRNPHFKEFIDKYERALKEDIKIDTIALREFLKTICPDITNERHAFHDSHEVLKAILDLFKSSNPNLQNKLITKNHFVHSDGKRTIREESMEDTGLLELPPPAKRQKKDNLQGWLLEKFSSEQSNEVNVTDTITRYEPKKSFFGLITREEEITEEVVVGRKTNVLEERKFSFAPNDLFLTLQRYECNYKVQVPFNLKIRKNHFESNLDADYRLNNFICHIGRHYISYVKKGDSWFKCDDEYVKKISLNEAKSAAKKAYIIHYKKLR
ncbi:MAG: hypothetical protein KR126chlam4_00833 [Candidatus Anoxychlamydiales bacterium]|nr:hypothetical protein [Candidatus Anoxychlamydiales bacterium]NGX41001.1 hypothetical protein [Candidatus Anoxychlamydiales bacterium]HEU64703.1 hypothetical protein [Chlamydiota bacterium]